MVSRQLPRQLNRGLALISLSRTKNFLHLKSWVSPRHEPSFTSKATLNAQTLASLQNQRKQAAQHLKVKQYNFNEIMELLEVPETDRILIDVREPSEYKDGYIPSAFNLPIMSMPDALSLEPREFQNQLGFSKPSLKNEVIFYCLAGVRSSVAASRAIQNGYSRIGEYKGSYKDWESQGGATSNNPSGNTVHK